MGADKNSSPKRELGLCHKFTTKNSHTSLPRSRSHHRPTNPKNKPQTMSKRKHDSRSKGLSCPANHQADCPQPPGGPSAWVRRTVRELRRTVRKTFPNLQYCTLNNRPSAMGLQTVRPTTDRPTLVRTVRELCATKIHRQNGSNERHARTREEHKEHLGCQAPRRPSATPARTVRQEKSCSPSPTS
jgi:hypothetical protein